MVGARRSNFTNVCRIFVVSNAHKKEEKWRFLKGGRPRALIPEEEVREGLAWRGKSKAFGSGVGRW